MKISLTATLCLFLFMVCASLEVYAEEKTSTTPQIEMLSDAVMDKLEKASETPEQSQLLLPLAGSWYYELKYWTKAGAEPQVSTGIATNEMILGGRYLQTKTNLILNIGGQNIPYEGWGILGYDVAKKSYTSVWADTMHTGTITGSGKYNEKLKTIEQKGFFTHPLVAKEQAYRSDLQFTDDGAHKRTFFMTGTSGKEFKVMEITFEKRS